MRNRTQPTATVEQHVEVTITMSLQDARELHRVLGQQHMPSQTGEVFRALHNKLRDSGLLEGTTR